MQYILHNVENRGKIYYIAKRRGEHWRMRRIEKVNSVLVLGLIIVTIMCLNACGGNQTSIHTTSPVTTSVSTKTPTENTDINMIEKFTSNQQKEINIFLSNFSEQFFDTFDNNNYDAAQLIDFAISYNRINNTNNMNNYSISANVIAQNIKRFFGIDINHKSTKENTYFDGKYEWEPASGEANSIISIVNEMYDKGNGTYLVKFKVYSMVDYQQENAQPSKFYPYTPQQAQKSTELEFNYDGSATIKSYTNNGIKTYQLVAYTKNDTSTNKNDTSTNKNETSSKTKDVVTGSSIIRNISDKIRNFKDKDNRYVLGIKNSYYNESNKSTYGDAFANFFSSPTWKYFEASNAEKVVEFTGFCMYHEVKVKASLQFIISKDGKTFKVGALNFNDVPQSQLITAGLMEKIFE